MAGKNHIERSFRLLFDDSGGTPRDLSSSLVKNSVSGLGIAREDIDMTGASDDLMSSLAGQGSGEITAQFIMDDTATTGSSTVLFPQVGNTGTFTGQFGQSGAAPTTGDPEWEGEYTLLAADVSITGGRAVISARWRVAPSATPAWGTVA